jgi:hypothetical protein
MTSAFKNRPGQPLRNFSWTVTSKYPNFYVGNSCLWPPDCVSVSPVDKAEKREEDNSDVVQSSIGNFGRWQLFLCLWISVLKFPVAWHSLGIVFLAPPVDSWCKRPEALQNLTDEQWRNLSQPSAPLAIHGRDSCRMFDMNYTAEPYTRPPANHSTVACVDWEYDRSVFQETIVTQVRISCIPRGSFATYFLTV